MARAKAPEVKVSTAHVDRRVQILKDLNKAHPEFVHVFRDSTTPAQELSLTGQEYVRNDTYDENGNGEVTKWRRDSIARIPREVYEAQRRATSEESSSSVKEIYAGQDGEWKTSDLGMKVAKAKDPNRIGKRGGEEWLQTQKL
jgi:hypothetical protein